MANSTAALMNLSGAMDLIGKSQNPLTPLYEAITNSLESISQRDYPDDEPPQITISMKFTGLLDEIKKLQEIEIVDNGVGFTSDSYSRFVEFFDKSKGYDNKGTGRLQFLHRFEKIRIESVYEDEGKKFKRECLCSIRQFVQNEQNNECDEDTEFLTKVCLSTPSLNSEESTFFNDLELGQLLQEIKNQFLLRFYLDTQKEGLVMPQISIVFEKNGREIARQSLEANDILVPESTGEIFVPYVKIVNAHADKIEWAPIKDKNENIKWAHFKIPEDDLRKNGVYLCSKDMPVKELTFRQIKKDESVDKHRYLTAFYGDVLDKPENVSDTVDSFKFPSKKETETQVHDLYFDENEEFLFFEDIKDQVNSAMPSIYEKLFKLQENQIKDIESIAKAHGIPLVIALKAKINLTDNEEVITKKIFTEQATRLAEKGYKAKMLYESLSELNPTADDYQEELENKTIELSALIEEQNKEELSRYILRREMVAGVLKKILEEKLDYQTQPRPKGKNRDKEGLVHDLIFKRKSTDSSVLNDLWILNEEFLHFEGCSELEIRQIKDSSGKKLLENIPEGKIEELGLKTDRRPDIFLFAEEGKCVLVELKAPDVDLSDHLNQMTKYCNLIANYSQKFDRFYCYLIGEKINPSVDLPGDYVETVNGDWLKSDLPIRSFDKNRDIIASSQIEVIQLSSIYSRAHRRNKSFADKLGLPDLLTEGS
ncbi:MAG: hypothetical protein COB24_14985 [Hyphomicrobiales bacterium]|nr:MAG: hypothetical protein COB24_14985 [Hyphomicrobiales bacterium]